jgi:hypothetical protein
MAAEFLDDLGIFACGDALHIFLLRSAPPLRGSLWLAISLLSVQPSQGREPTQYSLRAPTRRDRSQCLLAPAGYATRQHACAWLGPGIEAFGIAESNFATLRGLRLKHGGSLLAHGLVKRKAKAFGKVGSSLRVEQLQNSLEEVRIVVVSLVCV